MTLKKELETRWLLYQITSDEIFKKLEMGDVSFYCWFDPTAPSLHLWNFIGFMTAVHLMLAGNKYFALIWWATGMIGDPGWKDAERSFFSEERLRENEKAIGIQIKNILTWLEKTTGKNLSFELVNNYDFYTWMSILDFLREVGKYHTVNQMMSKDTVKKRITDPDKSISYTEFSYMLLQGYDFYKLFRDNGVILELGGQDQWGNLVTWVELVRKKTEKEVYAFTWPLITDASGKKFGKSEGNALFLDRAITSPYKVYQYFVNTEDKDIERYLKLLTLLPLTKISEIVINHQNNPEKREGQKRLAYEVVKIIHSENDAKVSEEISDFLFWDSDKVETLKDLDSKKLEIFISEIGGLEFTGDSLLELLVQSGLATSNSEARKNIAWGGYSLNEEKITDVNLSFADKWINGNLLLIRKGKKNFKIIKKYV